MAANYSSPNISGPTASYAGDPNDYSGGGSSVNPNALVDSIFGSLGPILSGIGSVVGATQGQPVTYVNGQPTFAPLQQQQQQQQQQNNMVMYIVLAVFFLMLLLAGAYFLTRK